MSFWSAILFIAVITASVKTAGQDINGNFRMLDNNIALKNDTSDNKILRMIKEIPLAGGSGTLSVGGDIREQVRFYSHVNFGDVPEGINDNDVYMLHRYMLHADLKLGSTFRIFTQLGSSLASGKNIISPIDQDKLGVWQTFLDIQISSPFEMRLRMGRQEVSFGSERFIATREGPNIRQAYDGLRYTLKFKKNTADFLIMYPVLNRYGVFDNTTDQGMLIYSGYLSRPLKDLGRFDFYYFGTHRNNILYANETNREIRHSLGARCSSNKNPFYYEGEGTWQIGSFNQYTIAAWQLWIHAGYKWQTGRLNPRIQAKGEIMSGDKDSTDKRINTFKPLTTKSPINDLLILGPANVIVFTPEAEVSPCRGLGIVFRYYAFWRFSTQDGIYNSDIKVVIRPGNSGYNQKERSMATGIVAELNYNPNKHLNITLLAGHFVPGEYVIHTGAGKNLDAMMLKFGYRF